MRAGEARGRQEGRRRPFPCATGRRSLQKQELVITILNRNHRQQLLRPEYSALDVLMRAPTYQVQKQLSDRTCRPSNSLEAMASLPWKSSLTFLRLSISELNCSGGRLCSTV